MTNLKVVFHNMHPLLLTFFFFFFAAEFIILLSRSFKVEKVMYNPSSLSCRLKCCHHDRNWKWGWVFCALGRKVWVAVTYDIAPAVESATDSPSSVPVFSS